MKMACGGSNPSEGYAMTCNRLLASVVLAAVVTSGCGGHLVYPSGPFRGRVVDADTGQPLVGAAVVAAWFLEQPLAVHGTATAYDVVEVLTDDKGEFMVPHQTHVTLVGSVNEPRITIYMSGYGPFPWSQRAPTGEALRDAFQEPTVIELVRGSTREKRLEYLDRAWVSGVSEEAIPNFVRLLNDERQLLGLQPIGKRVGK
jgi:hypothetical protein